ncbi:TetR/AcrR family transcriptional regulator [Mycobacterium intracellulare]|uniref:TetR/AcrR family transcriptional regulator n=1 Tax=Mycobacterium intracellulare TaxID=1767 RepID=UPI0019162297|nr:TetR/AcrR family transcriptional regulator [Mycobacterium intracellulare]MCA2355794.1 TetR/AcrR family transcriptional regulator [Mycobacterium intracellulare]MCA2365958.1 TetR/AcrR family transcriptional regulator [Mycobacterium intracellulare]
MGGTRGGRPKDEGRREAALAATRELLIAKGYDELTLSEVARAAGVSRPFVYDNWGTKFALVEDAIFTTDDPGPLIDDDKPFAESLTDLIAAMVAIQSDPAYLAGLPGLSADLYNRPDLVEQIESKYIAPIRAAYVRLIELGKAEGTVRPDVDGSALLDTIRGAVMLHTLINPSLDEAALIEHLRSTILHGVAKVATQRSPRKRSPGKRSPRR